MKGESGVVRRISNAEWEVMRVVWTYGTVKSSDIITILRKNINGQIPLLRPSLVG